MISVIIPTYKPQDYINECLESLKLQTLAKERYEVIIILNGEKEPYYNTISKQIDTQLNFRLIYTDIAGVSNARNVGIVEAKGDYISFIDDDDYISPAYLELLRKYAKSDTVVLSNAVAFDDKTKVIDVNYKQSRLFKKLKDKKCINLFQSRTFFNGPCMKLIPKVLISARRFDTSYKNGEDSLFMFQISDKINQLCFAEDDAIYYRRYRENSAHFSQNTYEKLKSKKNILCDYTCLYFSNFPNYNLVFSITRILATIKSIIK
ncbi:MAG: glycosyltransferase [Marinifilaceae bacterium]